MASVSINSQSSAVVENNAATLDINNLTIAAGTDSGLALIVGCQSGTTIDSANWDHNGTPQSMTQITAGTSGAGKHIEIWALRSPTTGNKTLHVETTGSGVFGYAICFDNVKNDGTLASAFVAATPTTGNSTTSSITISTATDRYTIEGVIPAGQPSSPSQTELFSLLGLGSYDGGGSIAAGGTSNTHSWTVPSGEWVSVGVSIVSTNSGALTTEYVSPIYAQSSSTMIGRRYV